jgi:ABC-type uncharacterized transport system permease subunit
LVIELQQLAAGLYLVASLGTFLGLALPDARLGRVAIGCLAVGAVVHGLAFAQLHTRTAPPLTDLSAAISLMAWLAVVFALALVVLLRGRLESLAGLVAPFAFVAVLASSYALASELRSAEGSVGGRWPHLHVILSSAGLALLGVAGLAGLLFLLENRMLKAKRPVRWRSRLPSLEALDRVNVAALALGFPLLTFGMIAGMIWSRRMTGHLWIGDPHAVWAALAWVVYLALSAARFAIGWRGREAAACAAVGFVFLLFAVLGAEALS